MEKILIQVYQRDFFVIISTFQLLNLDIVQPALEIFDENSPFPSPLPSNNYQDVQPYSKAPVPKLDLSKAKQIQEQYAKKITQPQQQNYNGYNPDAVGKIKQ